MANPDRTITVQLTPETRAFIDQQVESGLYASQSELVREGLRLIQEKHSASSIEQLRKLIDEGDNSGLSGPWDLEAFLAAHA